MRRREFIALIGGTAAAWPLSLRAQQSVPVVGFLHSGSPGEDQEHLTGFLRGLTDGGFVEGRNVAIEHRWAENHYDRFAELAVDLVRRSVAMIFTTPPNTTALAAKAATATIPIVFVTGSDPVSSGLVASFNRPGGNVTGVVNTSADLGSKRLALLDELVPTATTVAVLNNPNFDTRPQLADLAVAARQLGKQLVVLNAGTDSDLDQAFVTATEQKAGAAMTVSSIFFTLRRVRLAVLASRYALPLISVSGEIPRAGGLVSYGTSPREAFRLGGRYAGRILKGEKPSDLPVIQPTKFELVINLGTAKALGLAIPPSLLAIADEVIE
jgi:putative ABC transport system substrate-binding protein